jgi:hypothetical protein
MVAEMEGRTPLYDTAHTQLGHNGGPRMVN